MSASPPAHLAAARKQVPKVAIDKLTVIPGIGPARAADPYLRGIREVGDL